VQDQSNSVEPTRDTDERLLTLRDHYELLLHDVRQMISRRAMEASMDAAAASAAYWGAS
jgi:hypothetical protein